MKLELLILLEWLRFHMSVYETCASENKEKEKIAVTGLGRLPESQRTLVMPLLWGYYKLPPACVLLRSKMFAVNVVTDPNPRWGNGTRTPYIPPKRQ